MGEEGEERSEEMRGEIGRRGKMERWRRGIKMRGKVKGWKEGWWKRGGMIRAGLHLEIDPGGE